MYKGVAIKEPLFINVLVEDKGLVEIKAIEKNHSIYETQVLTYLRLTGIKKKKIKLLSYYLLVSI